MPDKMTQTKTTKRIFWEDLTPRQRKVICNGVGPKGLALRFSFLLVFLRAANQHDIDYWVGGSWADKLVADLRFFYQCLNSLWYFGRIKKIFYTLVAVIFLCAVLIGGWLSFHHGTPRGQEDLDAIG